MALTEEQLKELALRVDAHLCSEGHVATSAAYAIAFAANLVASLPKPEPVGRGWLDPISGKLVCAAPDGSTLLYTEAPIAQPASAPTGFDAEFLSKRLNRVAKLAGASMPDGFTHEQVAEAAGTILGQIAAAMEAKTASAPSEQKAVYQFRPECENWIDCTEQFYESWRGEKRELYTSPQPDHKAQLKDLREQVECSTITRDNMEGRLNIATVKLAAMKQQRDALLDFANHIATSPKLVGTGWQEMAQMVVAWAKGGA